MTKKSVRSNRVATCVVIFVCSICVLLYAWLFGSYQLAGHRAYEAYLESHRPFSASTDSFEFECRGVRYGFSETQVDECMRGAAEVSPRLYERPDDLCFQKRYTFEYPEWVNPLTGNKDSLIAEWYTVFFDDSGKAIRLERRLYMSKDSSCGTTEWDLEKRERIDWLESGQEDQEKPLKPSTE